MKACSSTSEISRRSEQRLFAKRQEILDEAQEYVKRYFESRTEEVSGSEILRLKKSYNEEVHSNRQKEQRLLKLKNIHSDLSKYKKSSSSKGALRKLRTQIQKYQLLTEEESEDQFRLIHKKNSLASAKLSQNLEVKNSIELYSKFSMIHCPIKAAQIAAETTLMNKRTEETQKKKQFGKVQEARSKSIGKLKSRQKHIKEAVKKSSMRAANLAILSEDKHEYMKKMRCILVKSIFSHFNSKQSATYTSQVIEQFAADLDQLKSTIKTDEIDDVRVLEAWKDQICTESALQQRFVELSNSNQHLVKHLDSLKQELSSIQASVEIMPLISSVKKRMETLHVNACTMTDKNVSKPSALENEVTAIKCAALFQIMTERCLRMLNLIKLNSGPYIQDLTRVIQEFSLSNMRRRTTLEDFEVMLMPKLKRQSFNNHSGFDASSLKVLLDSSLPSTSHGQLLTDFVINNHFVMTFASKATVQMYCQNAIDPAGTAKDIIASTFDLANKKVQKLVDRLSRLLRIVRDSSKCEEHQIQAIESNKNSRNFEDTSVSILDHSSVTKGEVNRLIKLIFHHVLQRKQKQNRLDNKVEESPKRPRFCISTFTLQPTDSNSHNGECLILKSSHKNRNSNFTHSPELPPIGSNNFFKEYKTLQQHLDHIYQLKKGPSSRVGTAHSTSSSHSHKKRMNFKVSSPKLLN